MIRSQKRKTFNTIYQLRLTAFNHL